MRAQQKFLFKELSLGVCYYPEHWDKSLWQSDLRRMLDAGLKTVRIAEFAWNKFEPCEGEFTFEFFDEFLDLAESVGMNVIFCTPTATPPAWLTTKYPEVLNCDINGHPYKHGMRRHYNYNSPKYNELCARLVEKIAEHYGRRKCIIGWQIDNEMNCETSEFYSAADSVAFREFLKQKYGTLDELNEKWGAVFWNQTYTDWEEIFVPERTVNNSVNPHRMLDYYRFISASVIRFCKMQSDIIKKHAKPGDFVTTNGRFANIDNHKMNDEALDVYVYDSYPNFPYCLDDPYDPNGLNDRKWARNLCETRSICPNFAIMEQQSGTLGWNTRMEGPAPKPGQIKLWVMQSIAHGADYISFFRWRTCAFGTEMYWHGILDYDNRDNRKLAEIKEIAQRVEKIGGVVNAKYAAQVAILKDYDNEFDAQCDKWHERTWWKSEAEILAASQWNHTPIDYAYLAAGTDANDLAQYKVLFYTHPFILTEERAAILAQWVKAGGILIFGARAGMKDIYGRCPMQSMPGPFAPLTGTRVVDWTFIGKADEPSKINWNGKTIEGGIFNDVLEAEALENAKLVDGAATDSSGIAKPKVTTPKVLATYTNNYYAGKPALMETPLGKGKILHFGGTFTQENVKAFMEYTGVLAPFAELVDAPRQVELAVRQKDGKNYLFILNYGRAATSVKLKRPMLDLDTGKEISGKTALAAFETKVLAY